VQDILERVLAGNGEEARKGGVVWHTQGSGKSLTMVMLAKALALHPAILNPKVILVTDRIDLDDQIWGTFRACGLEPEQATTGKHLVDLLLDERAHVVTTVIHKFAAATTSRALKKVGRNTFVLVDEGHRSQYNEHHARMRLALKGACFIAFTGTPLAKSAQRNTFATFGDLFKPAYTISRAVEDKAVKPLLYEARHVPQPVETEAIDGWFEKITMSLTPEQKADLKRKFSSERQLNKATQKVRMIAWDIGLHYAATYQGTGLKGQLVAPDKRTALQYKRFLDEFGKVSSDVLISPPTQREGEDKGTEASQEEKAFWDSMMDRYGSEKKYNQLLINAFKHGEQPEIIIVVDKLLTGFDAPCNTVLYLARTLKEHTLLQAIARVNRLYEGKEYGLDPRLQRRHRGARSGHRLLRPARGLRSAGPGRNRRVCRGQEPPGFRNCIRRFGISSMGSRARPIRRCMRCICGTTPCGRRSMSGSASSRARWPWRCHPWAFWKPRRKKRSTSTRRT
jgi:type I restriction enzyme, R subunit